MGRADRQSNVRHRQSRLTFARLDLTAKLLPNTYGNDAAHWGFQAPRGSPGRENFDAGGPTVDILDVVPDPRNAGVGSITISFSEPVSGFDLADLTLTRNGGANLLTGSQTLTSTDNITFTLGNLSGLTGAAGNWLGEVALNHTSEQRFRLILQVGLTVLAVKLLYDAVVQAGWLHAVGL